MEGDHDGVPVRRARALERRRRLLEATFEIVGREGVDAVSHRRVAQLAGVPLGSTTYYFASREQMLVEALEHCANAESKYLGEQLKQLAEASSGRDELVEALTKLVMDQLGDERWRTVAQYALLQEAGRRPELRKVAGSWSDALCAIFEDAFRALGSSDPPLDARMFLAMLDGLLLAALADPDTSRRKTRAVVRSALDRYLTFAQEAGGSPVATSSD